VEQVIRLMVRPAISIIVEGDGESWSAYAPAVPGCIAVGNSLEEVERDMEDALRAYFEEVERADEEALGAKAAK
jgi:predicted RNase H-like HicB family nuclease